MGSCVEGYNRNARSLCGRHGVVASQHVLEDRNVLGGAARDHEQAPDTVRVICRERRTSAIAATGNAG